MKGLGRHIPRIALFVIILASLVPASAFAQKICDMGMARAWVDDAMLRRVEGIWEFCGDDTRVLIRRAGYDDNLYDIIAIETPDTRVQPGDVIGYLKASPVGTKFEMSVCRGGERGVLAEPGKCLAELNEREDAILVKGRKMKFSLASRWFLPSFWRAVRLSVKNPLDNLPEGLVRVYPEPTGREPEYL